jgi:hypothetical protein
LSAGTVISNGKRDVVRSLYHTVLKKFEENGQSDNYLRLYRHKKNFEAASAASGSFLKKLGGQLNYFFTYTLQDWWWGFGFQKEKIFRNTFLIFLLWIMLGSVCFKGILKEYPAVFEDKTLADQFNDRRTNLLSRIGISIIGIAILFFGIEFKANQLKFNNRVLSVLIVSIYLSGLVCLGFLANLILTV